MLDKQYQPVVLTSTHPQEAQMWALTTTEKESILEELEPRTQDAATDLAIAAKEEKTTVVLPDEYCNFLSVFSEQEAECFPPSQSWDHAIDLKRDTPNHLNCSVYPMNCIEDKVLDDFIDEQLAKGYIRLSISPYASSFFFIKKKDGKLRPVQDYRGVNKWTVRNQYPLPLITLLICNLGGALLYMKLDIWWGYNNVRIKAGDE